MSAALLLCLVVGVTDGDTITVRCGEAAQERVRLAEIDAPERKQPFGTRAKQALSELVYGQTVALSVIDTDRYGRKVAYVSRDGIDIGRMMVGTGLAHCYTRYLRGDWCPKLEAQAREGRNGLWVDAEVVRPWEWRKGAR